MKTLLRIIKEIIYVDNFILVSLYKISEEKIYYRILLFQ